MPNKSRKKRERKEATKEARTAAIKARIEAIPNTVKCMACKKDVEGSITEKHFEDDCKEGKGLKLKEYQETYPRAPIKSPRILKMETKMQERIRTKGVKQQKRAGMRPIMTSKPPPSSQSDLEARMNHLARNQDIIVKQLNVMVPTIQENQVNGRETWLWMRAVLELLNDKDIVPKEEFMLKKTQLLEEAERIHNEREKAAAESMFCEEHGDELEGGKCPTCEEEKSDVNVEISEDDGSGEASASGAESGGDGSEDQGGSGEGDTAGQEGTHASGKVSQRESGAGMG